MTTRLQQHTELLAKSGRNRDMALTFVQGLGAVGLLDAVTRCALSTPADVAALDVQMRYLKAVRNVFHTATHHADFPRETFAHTLVAADDPDALAYLISGGFHDHGFHIQLGNALDAAERQPALPRLGSFLSQGSPQHQPTSVLTAYLVSLARNPEAALEFLAAPGLAERLDVPGRSRTRSP